MAAIRLPAPESGASPLEEALAARRSRRRFAGRTLSLDLLSRLLFAAQGVTGESQGVQLRTAPSAGALYPLEPYVVAVRVEGLEPGLYRYLPRAHALEEIRTGDLEGALHAACLSQRPLLGAGFHLVLTELPARMVGKYGSRTDRYSAMEAGAIGQNLYLLAEALGLGTVAVGAFDDRALAALLGVDGETEIPLLVHPVGVPAE